MGLSFHGVPASPDPILTFCFWLCWSSHHSILPSPACHSLLRLFQQLFYLFRQLFYLLCMMFVYACAVYVLHVPEYGSVKYVCQCVGLLRVSVCLWVMCACMCVPLCVCLCMCYVYLCVHVAVNYMCLYVGPFACMYVPVYVCVGVLCVCVSLRLGIRVYAWVCVICVCACRSQRLMLAAFYCSPMYSWDRPSLNMELTVV